MNKYYVIENMDGVTTEREIPENEVSKLSKTKQIKLVTSEGNVILFPGNKEEEKKDDTHIVYSKDDDDDDEDDDSFFFNNKVFLKHIYGKGKTSKIAAMLPFLDKEDLDEIITKKMNGDKGYRDLNIVVTYPFLSKEQLDLLFKKALNKEINVAIEPILPFLSDETLSWFVDQYVNGMYQDISVDLIYPFLSKESIKKIFKYTIEKDNM